MQFRSIKYPILSIYELLRSVSLIRQGALTATAAAALPVTWYAGLPILCITPLMFAMLAADEEKYASWLPLVALSKALGIVSLLVFAVTAFPNALRFGSSGDLSYFGSILLAVIFSIADTAIGVYCFRRNRTLCK
jgi:hypothetical protein